MIPPLIRAAIGHPAQQIQQVTARIHQRNRNNRPGSGHDGRGDTLDHDEAPAGIGSVARPVLSGASFTFRPDTPPVIREFVANFHPRMVGLTGSPEAVAKVAKEYAVWSQKGDKRADGGYDVNHSRAEILMGPDGAPIALLPDDQGVDGIAAALDKWVR